MIIWRSETDHAARVLGDVPPGMIEITRVEQADRDTHIWFAPVPATPAGDVLPDPVGMLTAMAGMHHEWFEAWQAAGFSEDQAYGLVTEIVRSAFTQG